MPDSLPDPSPAPFKVTVNYLSSDSPTPVVYLTKPPPGAKRDSTEIHRRQVVMHDARDLIETAEPAERDDPNDRLSLDLQGFELVTHETRASNLWNREEVRRVYYPEVEALVAAATGADKVLAFDHNVRSFTKAKRGEDGAAMPVKFAHNDYTLKSGPKRVRDLLPAEEAERRLQRRFTVINVWKPITGPVLEAPLGICDARSIDRKDFIETNLIYEDRIGEVYSVAFNESQRWYYFSKMRSNEATLIKCFDSLDDGRACFTAHSAFNDPNTPPDAPCRESIEVRTLAFY